MKTSAQRVARYVLYDNLVTTLQSVPLSVPVPSAKAVHLCLWLLKPVYLIFYVEH